MKIRLFALLVCLMSVFKTQAQTSPPPGAKLNYNQVMFEYERVKGADNYLLQLAEDKPGSAFRHLLAEQKDSATATLITNLQFGKRYQWRYAGISNGKQLTWNGPYYFEIDEDSFIHKKIVTLTVTQNDTTANAGGLIVNDCTHTVVDRAGNLVWYLSQVKWFFARTQYTKSVANVSKTIKNVDIKPGIYDLRFTSAGTTTDLEDSLAIERGLAGNILWMAPNDGKVSGFHGEAYNHDFKRLSNGHYMVLGNELWRKVPPGSVDSIGSKKKYADRQFFDSVEYAKVEFGTVIEYDKRGNVVWSWNSHNYLEYDPLRPKIRNQHIEYQLKTHINAFSTDKKNQFVYVGFRDISRIVKVEKSTGKVVDSWGLQSTAGGAAHPLRLHLQHDANILDDSTIAIFNNNDYIRYDSLPDVLLISQQPTDTGYVIWQYTCPLDSADRRISRNGGNVDELKNGNLLVCMGNLDRIFEITRDKKIVWQAIIKNNEYEGANYYHRLYRAHYISSLYPCYFTFQTDKDTVIKKTPAFTIKIFNKGSENDSYNIKVSSGKYTQQFSTGMVSANHSTTLNITSDAHVHKGDKIEVTVSSLTNPDFERKRWVVVE